MVRGSLQSSLVVQTRCHGAVCTICCACLVLSRTPCCSCAVGVAVQAPPFAVAFWHSHLIGFQSSLSHSSGRRMPATHNLACPCAVFFLTHLLSIGVQWQGRCLIWECTHCLATRRTVPGTHTVCFQVWQKVGGPATFLCRSLC